MARGSNYSNADYRIFRTKAEKLRVRGLSYKEIMEVIPVSKSTLSAWLQEIKLTAAQIKRLGGLYDTQLRGAKANQKKSQERKERVRQESIKDISSPTIEMLRIAGAMLYWAEGNKTLKTGITNSDPAFVVFIVEWLQHVLHISPKQLSAHLNLHKGQDDIKSKKFWSALTGIPITNFGKTFIKPNGKGYRKNCLYYGTLQIRVKGTGTVLLRHKILGWIEGFIRHYIPETVVETYYCKHTGR